MSTQLSDEANTVLQLLEDRQWHPLEEVLAKLIPTIPPGKALRRYEHNQNYRTKTFGPRQAPELSMVEQMTSGAKSIATDTYRSLAKRYVEIREEAGRKYVRRRATVLPPRVRAHHVAPVEFRQVQPDPLPTPSSEPAGFYSEHQFRQVIVEELDKAVTELRTFIREQLASVRHPAHQPQPPNGLPPELTRPEIMARSRHFPDGESRHPS